MANRESRRTRAQDESAQPTAEDRRVEREEFVASRERTPPGQFLREVRQELRKVAWPTRQEVVLYTVVVLAATIVITSIVFGMDFIFGRLVFTIFGS